MTRLHIVPDKDRAPSPLLATAIALTRGQVEAWKAEREFADAAVPRALFVVEFRDTDGVWRPCCGDAYPTEDEAVRCSERSMLVTRVRRYVPEGGAR